MMIVPANHNCAEGLPIRLGSQSLFRNQAVDLVIVRDDWSHRRPDNPLAFPSLEKLKYHYETEFRG